MKMVKLFFVVALLALALTGCAAPAAAPVAEEAAAPATEAAEAAPAAAEGPAGVFRSPMRTGATVASRASGCSWARRESAASVIMIPPDGRSA